MKLLKNVLALAIALLAIIYFFPHDNTILNKDPAVSVKAEPSSSENPSPSSSSIDVLQQAFEQRLSNVQVNAEVTVKKILSDDTKGSRHQRFIVTSRSGLTVLVAHNIDLAERLDDLAVGEALTLYGEYEWNEKGGVVHWTHRDPQGRHVDGWIEWRGRRYQ